MRSASDDNFNDLMKEPVVYVMFSAPWAGPCNLARPSFQGCEGRFGNQILFAEFSLDDNPKTPQKYGVRAVPLFMLFERGIPTSIKVGALGQEILDGVCEAYLDKVPV